MKKLIIVLMMVAMASFLFVGCLPGTTTPPTTPPPTTPTVAATTAPIITACSGISLTSAATQYTNAITVAGVAPLGSIIKMYVNDVWVGTGASGATGIFPVVVVTIGVIADGVKTVYVTATQPGLAESAPSTTYTLTFDTVAPKIVSVVADFGDDTYTVTFDEKVDFTASPAANSALTFGNWAVNGITLLVTDTFTKVSDTVVKITDNTTAVIAAGNVYIIACMNIADSLGNAMAAVFSSPYIGVTVP